MRDASQIKKNILHFFRQKTLIKTPTLILKKMMQDPKKKNCRFP